MGRMKMRTLSCLAVILTSLVNQGQPSVCGDFVTVEGNRTGDLSSPNYPSNYSASSVCVWWLEAPSRHIVNIRINSMIGQPSSSGCADYLEVRDDSSSGPLLVRTCSAVGVTLSSTSRWMWVKFVSDAAVNHQGFSATYYGTYTGNTNETSPIPGCQNTNWRCRNKECVSWSYRCDGINDCGCVGNSCDEDGCHGISWNENDRVICGVCVGSFVFLTTFFGIGFYDIWSKRRQQKKYEQEMEERKRREKQERARKQAASLGIPSIEIAGSTAGSTSGSQKSPTLSRQTSTVSAFKTPTPTPASSPAPLRKGVSFPPGTKAT